MMQGIKSARRNFSSICHVSFWIHCFILEFKGIFQVFYVMIDLKTKVDLIPWHSLDEDDGAEKSEDEGVHEGEHVVRMKSSRGVSVYHCWRAFQYCSSETMDPPPLSCHWHMSSALFSLPNEAIDRCSTENKRVTLKKCHFHNHGEYFLGENKQFRQMESYKVDVITCSK